MDVEPENCVRLPLAGLPVVVTVPDPPPTLEQSANQFVEEFGSTLILQAIPAATDSVEAAAEFPD